MRTGLFFSLCLWSLSAPLCAEAKNYAAEDVPGVLSESVTFIFRSSIPVIIENRKWQNLPIGTGFFVNVPIDSESYESAIYLVTSRHVIIGLSRIFLRLTLKDTGNSEFWQVELNPQKRGVFFHPDPTVDLAIINYAPAHKSYAYSPVQSNSVPNKKTLLDLGLRTGDEVLMPGLFYWVPGLKKNIPFVRFGRIAMIPDEPISWGEEGNLDLLLLESHAYPGSSGAPVFFVGARKGIPGLNTFVLVGVNKGNYFNRNEVDRVVLNNATTTYFSREHAAVNAVVPAYLLDELLYSPEVVAHRKINMGVR